MSKSSHLSVNKKTVIFYDSQIKINRSSNNVEEKLNFDIIIPTLKKIDSFILVDLKDNKSEKYIEDNILRSDLVIIGNISKSISIFVTITSIRLNILTIYWNKPNFTPFFVIDQNINFSLFYKNSICSKETLRNAINFILYLAKINKSELLSKLKINLPKNNLNTQINLSSIKSIDNSHFEANGDIKFKYKDTFDNWINHLNIYYDNLTHLDNAEKNKFHSFICDLFLVFHEKYINERKFDDWAEKYIILKERLPGCIHFFELTSQKILNDSIKDKELILNLIWQKAVEDLWNEAEYFINNLISKKIFLCVPYYSFIYAYWEYNNLFWISLDPKWSSKNEDILNKSVQWVKKDIESKRIYKSSQIDVKPFHLNNFLCLSLLKLGSNKESIALFNQIKGSNYAHDLYFVFHLWIYNEINLAQSFFSEIPASRIYHDKFNPVFFITLHATLSIIFESFEDGFTTLDYIQKHFPNAFTNKDNIHRMEYLMLALILKKVTKRELFEKFLNKNLGSRIINDGVSHFILHRLNYNTSNTLENRIKNKLDF